MSPKLNIDKRRPTPIYTLFKVLGRITASKYRSLLYGNLLCLTSYSKQSIQKVIDVKLGKWELVSKTIKALP